MQSLPVTATTIVTAPATTTQTSTATDNNSAAQAVEPFGSVLARQRANADTHQDGKKPDSKKSALSSANDLINIATSNDPTTQSQLPTPDTASIPPASLLAALLPATVVTNSPATKEKTDPQASAPSGVSTLPSDMLAALLPAAVVTNSPATKEKTDPTASAPSGVSTLPSDMLTMMVPTAATTNGKGIQESITNGGKKTQSPPIATVAIGTSLLSAGNKTASGISGGASALPGAQGNAKPETATTGNTSKDNTFAAALATLSKDGAKTAQPDAGATKIAAQPVAPTALDSLVQSGIAPIVASQSGVAQAAQSVINTPVTDKAWGNEFNQKITWMATQHVQTAELHLNPPNLGPLDVVLKVSGDQATALFTSPHAAVRDAVQQALPQLRDMLAGNGITLGNATVSDQSPKDQQAWQASQQQKGNGGAAGKIDTPVTTGGIAAVATVSLGSRHQGMVDTFA